MTYLVMLFLLLGAVRYYRRKLREYRREDALSLLRCINMARRCRDRATSEALTESLQALDHARGWKSSLVKWKAREVMA